MAIAGYDGDSVSVSTSDPITLRQQVGSLPPYVLAAWRLRYVPVDGVDLEARALINQGAVAICAQGGQPVVSQFEISMRSRFRERRVFQWLVPDAVAALSH